MFLFARTLTNFTNVPCEAFKSLDHLWWPVDTGPEQIPHLDEPQSASNFMEILSQNTHYERQFGPENTKKYTAAVVVVFWHLPYVRVAIKTEPRRACAPGSGARAAARGHQLSANAGKQTALRWQNSSL